MDNLAYIGQEQIEAAINKLKAKGLVFSQSYQTLIDDYPKIKNNPKLLKRWTTLKSYADKTKATIQAINNSVDKSVNWLKDVFGLNGTALNGMDEVGALPLIPVAYILAAIAAMTYIINQIYQFHIDAVNYDKFLATKPTPQQVIDFNVDKNAAIAKTSVIGNLTDVVKYGVIAFGIYLAYKAFKEKS